MRVRIVEEIMPPIIGTAIRRITEPVPVDQRIGSSPAMIATTVITFGRTRSTAPIIMARARSSRVASRCSTAHARLISVQAWSR